MKKTEWISVRDRLPKENVNVLVSDKLGSNDVSMSTGLLWKGEWQGYNGKAHEYAEYITYWMPLPEPPK